jgi:hypothetical protein
MKKLLALLAVMIGTVGTIGAQRPNAYYKRRSVNQYSFTPRQRNANTLNQQQKKDRGVIERDDVIPASREPLYQGDNYYQKRMVKVFSALKEHKLDKAAGYWRDMEEKAAKDKEIDASRSIKMQLHPVWQLSECMMMNIRDGRGKSKECLLYDPWSAYSLLKTLSDNSDDMRNANLFLTHKDIEMQVADIKRSIEQNLIDSVRKAGTEADYDRLLQELFNYHNQTPLEKERELVAYNAIIQTDLVHECQRYMDKYQTLNPNHLKNMELRRDSLAFVQLDSTAKACQKYLSNYPNSRFTASVKKLLELYAFNELAPTVEACKEYIRLYPTAEYTVKVKALQCEYAFRDAKKTNTFGVFREFLKDYRDSEHTEEARQLMEQALLKRFFSSSVSLDDLFKYFSTSNGAIGVDDTRLYSLYTNLLFLPTSSMMKDCDGLIGSVNISTIVNGTESDETLDFNRQGLLTRHYHSRSGRIETFRYEFDPTNGFTIVSKSDGSGNTISYSTKWNEKGEIIEIKGSDGSKIVYADDAGYMKKVTYYKGANPVKTDYYGFRFRLEKSQRGGGIVIVYEYNSEGDVKVMHKQRGNTIMETTTYEYDYGNVNSKGNVWTTMLQYNNGSQLLTKKRHFNQMVDRTQSEIMHSYYLNE